MTCICGARLLGVCVSSVRGHAILDDAEHCERCKEREHDHAAGHAAIIGPAFAVSGFPRCRTRVRRSGASGQIGLPTTARDPDAAAGVSLASS